MQAKHQRRTTLQAYYIFFTLLLPLYLAQYVQLADYVADYSTTQVTGNNGWTYAFATSAMGSPTNGEVYRSNSCNSNTGWTTNAATCLTMGQNYFHVSHTTLCTFNVYHEAVVLWNSNIDASRYTSYQVVYSFTHIAVCGDGVNIKVITDGTTQVNANILFQTVANTFVVGSLVQLQARINPIGDCGCDGVSPVTIRVMGLPVMCFGVSTFNSTVCSGHGVCVASNTCACAADYTGPNCQLPLCNGIAPTNPIACSGRGKCNGVNSCSCDSMFTGNNCQYTVCNGIASNDPLVCNGTGFCRSPSYQQHYVMPYGYSSPYGVNTGPPPLFGSRDFDIFVTLMKASATQGVIFAYDRNSEGNVQFRMISNADGSLTFESASLGATYSHAMNSAAVVSLNTWYTLHMARRGLIVTLYVNGTQVATGSSSQVYSIAETIANRPNFLIGSRYAPGTGTTQEMTFGGQILELRIIADSYSLSPVCACTNIAGSCNANCYGICITY